MKTVARIVGAVMVGVALVATGGVAFAAPYADFDAKGNVVMVEGCSNAACNGVRTDFSQVNPLVPMVADAYGRIPGNGHSFSEDPLVPKTADAPYDPSVGH